MITYQEFDINNYQDSLLIVDKNVARIYSIVGNNCLVLEGGEDAKCWNTVITICDWLQHKGATKSTQVVAVGGGTIGDVVGFACSVYKRGVQLLHVPTTLLAMVDSSIGGKTAINNNGVKNIIGTIYSADTLIDVRFVSTLPNQQVINGKGEIAKYMLLDANIAQHKGSWQSIIKMCAQYKQSIVQLDYYDNKGIRIALNMGHTVAHAQELQYNISHGQAVMSGLYQELLLAHSLQLVDKHYIDSWLEKVPHFDRYKVDQHTVELMLHDKKNDSKDITFVLPKQPFGYQVTQLSCQQVLNTLVDK